MNTRRSRALMANVRRIPPKPDLQTNESKETYTRQEIDELLKDLTPQKGENGQRGVKGYTGPRGFQGNEGVGGGTGNQGDKGDAGERGVKGYTGPRGVQGSRGVRGFEGNEGRQGNIGSRGITGEKGPQGKTGSIGMRGKQGPMGPRGNQGIAGKDAAPGKDGTQGPAGVSPTIFVEYESGRFRININGVKGEWMIIPSSGRSSGGGAPSAKRVRITDDYTVTKHVNAVFVDATDNDVAITIPKADSGLFNIKIMREDRTSNTVTLVPRDGDNIMDESTALVLRVAGIDLYSNGIDSWRYV